MANRPEENEDTQDRHHEHAADPEAQKMHPTHRGKDPDDPYLTHVNNKGMTEKHAGVGSMASEPTEATTEQGGEEAGKPEK